MRRKSVNCLEEEIEELKKEIVKLKEELSNLSRLYDQQIVNLQTVVSRNAKYCGITEKRFF